MNQFVYNISTKVYFGENQLGHLGEELKKFRNKGIDDLWRRFY